MLINDTKKTVFVHIPKCAGVSVREKIKEYDESGGRFWHVKKHRELGIVDYAHIPLFILREYFKEEYSKVSEYEAFAVLRDPFERFPSSFSQHLIAAYGSSINGFKKNELHSKVDFVIKFLMRHFDAESYLPYDYIHFQRQVDFVDDRGSRLVDHLYMLADVSLMLGEIGDRLGIPASSGRVVNASKRNQALVFRNNMSRAVYGATKSVLRPLLPGSAKRALVRASKNVFFVHRDKQFVDVFSSDSIMDFVSNYYRDDIALVDEIRGAD